MRQTPRTSIFRAFALGLLAIVVAGCDQQAGPGPGAGNTPERTVANSDPAEGATSMDHSAMGHEPAGHDATHTADQPGSGPFESAAALFAENVFGVNSGDYGITFAADGETVFFTRAIPTANTETIFGTHLVDGQWSEPEEAPFSGDYQDKEPFVSPDGRRVYFASRRPTRGSMSKRDFDIWYVERDAAGGWSEAVNVAAVNSPFDDDYPAVAADGTIAFARNDANGNVDLFVAAVEDGILAAPRKLGWPVNTVYAEADPWISPDGNTIIFSSAQRSPQAQGQGDLYAAHRRKEGWSEPASLGLHVNNIGHDYGPTMSPDGATFYFSRGFGGQVWAVPASILENIDVIR